jgi:hypothetical protein
MTAAGRRRLLPWLEIITTETKASIMTAAAAG